MINKLVKELRRVNEGGSFEVSDYNPYTCLGWINVRGASLPLKQTLNLPGGAFWCDDTHIEYKGRKVHLIPLP